MLGGLGYITTTLGAAFTLAFVGLGLAVMALLGMLDLASTMRMGLVITTGTMNCHFKMLG